MHRCVRYASTLCRHSSRLVAVDVPSPAPVALEFEGRSSARSRTRGVLPARMNAFLVLACLFSCLGVSAAVPRPKSVNVALQAKWSSTPFLLEAAEFIADCRDDLFWSFLDQWMISEHGAGDMNDQFCFTRILDVGAAILNGPLHSVFHLSLLLRSASPKLVMYRQLAQESLQHHGISQAWTVPNEGGGSHNFPTGDSWLSGESPRSLHGKCCFADVGSHLIFEESELILWLGTVQKEQRDHSVIELFEFDHVYPAGWSPTTIAVLYGALGTTCFQKFHHILEDAAREGHIQYVLRPLLAAGCGYEAGHCASVGANVQFNLGGYGIELALKNMEYKAIDDSDVKKSEVMDEARTDDLAEEVRGFIFSKLLERKPELSDELMTFRDYLLSSSVSDTMNVWELKDLGFQTAQKIMSAADPLLLMQDINQNFPNLVSSISRLKINQTIKDEIIANQKMVNPGKNLFAINGALVNLESLDLYSLIEVVLGEVSLADVISKLKIPVKYARSLMQITVPAELSTFRVDFRSQHVHYLNNLEEDNMYKRWRNNVQELLMPIFPGQMHYIRKNLFHAVYIIDPASVVGLEVVSTILYYHESSVPIRFGIILISPSAAEIISDNGGDLPELETWRDTLSDLAGKLFLYIKEKRGVMDAFRFLSRVNEARNEEGSKNVELTHIEDGFFETVKPWAKSPPQKILRECEKSREYLEPILQSALSVYKLGLHLLHPCLLMNGIVHTSTDLQHGVFKLMNEELLRLQEGVYYGHISSQTDVLDKFLKERSYSRYNPEIVATKKEDLKYISLAKATTTGHKVWTRMQYMHSLGTEDDIKPITHLVSVNLSTKQGLKLLQQLVRYLMDGSKRGRVGLLFTALPNAVTAEETSASFLFAGIVMKVLSTSGNPRKALLFLQKFLPWYGAHESWMVDGTQLIVDNALHFAKEVNLKLELDIDFAKDCLRQIAEETSFLSMHLGIPAGVNAVITDGKIFIQTEKSLFTADDFSLLEAVEFDRRVNPVFDVIEKVDWEGIEPDDLTSDFLSSVIMVVSSAIALRSRGAESVRMDILQSKHSAIIQESENSIIHVDAIIDPLSSGGQKLSPFLVLLQNWFHASMRVYLNPMNSLADLPLKNFYRFVVPSKQVFNSDDKLITGPVAVFSNMPSTKTLTLNLDVPERWLVEPVKAVYDLDNIVLEKLGESRTMFAVFELEALMLTGHCHEQLNNEPPRGLQLILGTKFCPYIVDTIVMANLGYWQLKAAPGVWTLSLAPGKSSELYTFRGPGEGENNGPVSKQVVIKNLRGELLFLEVVKRRGKETKSVLNVDEDMDDDVAKKGKITWNQNLLKWASDLIGGGKQPSATLAQQGSKEWKVERHGEQVNIFSIASGHLYERFLKIMMLSVLKNSRRPVKFWFIKNYLSPQFKEFIPYMAKEYGFEYDLVTYKWPTWLHKQTEKQRIIWAYKILFLDVVFPLSLKKVIFVDADQVVRADMGELYDMDIKGRPLAYTPFCDNNKEMDGYRFWNQGFWKDHLRGKPYHISALYVVDLVKFRQMAAGDNLRVVYETLSKDPGSLANLDQDLPNYAQHQVPIFSLPQEWLWCESWCGNATKMKAKTIDLCNNPMTKEPKLQGAQRIVAEWPALDEEARVLTAELFTDETDMVTSKTQVTSQSSSSDVAFSVVETSSEL